MKLGRDSGLEDNKSIVKTFLFLIIIENSSTRVDGIPVLLFLICVENLTREFFPSVVVKLKNGMDTQATTRGKNIGLKGMRYQNFVFLILLGEIPLEFVYK